MRIILALAAHFKPSANHRAAAGGRRGLTRGSASHDALSTVALAQGAAATLASARLDALQPARTPRIHRYAGLRTPEHTLKPMATGPCVCGFCCPLVDEQSHHPHRYRNKAHHWDL